MATATNYINPNSAYYLTLTMTESNVSVANNTSDVTVTGTITRVGSTYKSHYSQSTNTVKINGTTYSPTSAYDVWNNWSSQVFSYTQTISHNADGSKSIYIYWAFVGGNPGGQWNPNGSVDYTLTLTTIARKSSPTLSTSSISMPASGNAITVNTNRASSSFTHTITLAIGSTQIAQRTGVGASTTFTYSDLTNIYSAIPSATSASVAVTCETFNGSTSLGSNSTSFTANINNGAKPTFSNYTYSDTNSTTTTITGNNQLMIQGYSTPTIAISSANKATANYSATMSKYSMNFAQASAVVSYSTSDISQTIASPTSTGDLTMTVSAIDSREYSTAVTKTVTVIPYSAPVINASATRTGNYYSETTLSIAGSFSGIPVSGTNKNTIDTTSGVQYRYKKSSESTWGSWTNRAITISNTSYSATDLIISFDNAYQWDIQVQATDKLTTTTVSLTLPVGLPIMYIGKDGRVSLGGVPTESIQSGHVSTFQINNGTAYIENNVSGKGAQWYAKRTDTSTSVAFGVGDGGVNHGVWSDKLNKWLVYGDASNCYLNGQSEKAKNYTASSWISARDIATATNANTATGGSWAVVADVKSYSGDWSIGCMDSWTNNPLTFSFVTDANYNSKNNTSASWNIYPDGTTSFRQKIESTSDGWTKIWLSNNVRLWHKYVQISRTFSASWWSAVSSPPDGPSGLSSTVLGWANVIADDAAITLNCRYSKPANQFVTESQNKYTGSVTTNLTYDLYVIDYDA